MLRHVLQLFVELGDSLLVRLERLLGRLVEELCERVRSVSFAWERAPSRRVLTHPLALDFLESALGFRLVRVGGRARRRGGRRDLAVGA